MQQTELKSQEIENHEARRSSEAPGYVKTLAELRKEFEYMAVRCMFGIERKDNGEYSGSGGQTFILWAGYWECARKNGVIVGVDAEYINMHT